MNARHLLAPLAISLLTLAFCACKPPYSMELPDGFKRFGRTSDYRLITADGVRVEAREVENYPAASLEFWTEALELHLAAQGYAPKSRRCFETTKGLAGCTVDVMLPHGAEDWVLSTTLFVVGERIVLVEAAAQFERFSPVEERLRAAIATFDPGR
ncbi:MAG TPA: hypothetical protein VM285_14385 [Polyangia bacterium]|nr:hypothetical protein [Polyangia bacterium]